MRAKWPSVLRASIYGWKAKKATSFVRTVKRKFLLFKVSHQWLVAGGKSKFVILQLYNSAVSRIDHEVNSRLARIHEELFSFLTSLDLMSFLESSTLKLSLIFFDNTTADKILKCSIKNWCHFELTPSQQPSPIVLALILHSSGNKFKRREKKKTWNGSCHISWILELRRQGVKQGWRHSVTAIE